MPEFGFKLSKEEKVEMCRWLFDIGCIFIPDIHYKIPEIIEIKNFKKIVKEDLLNVWFYILHKDFQSYPLEISELVRNPHIGNFYYIISRTGGPAISLTNFPYIEDNSIIEINPDNLQYYPDYWTKDLSLNFKAPQELKDLYNEIVKYIKKRSKKVTITLKDGKSRRSFYVSRSFFEEAKEKNIRITLWEEEIYNPDTKT